MSHISESYSQVTLVNPIKQNMLTYCVKCRKYTENVNTNIFKTKKDRLIIQSKCAVCGIKKFRFVKEQEAKGLLSNLGIKTRLNKIPLLGDILL